MSKHNNTLWQWLCDLAGSPDVEARLPVAERVSAVRQVLWVAIATGGSFSLFNYAIGFEMLAAIELFAAATLLVLYPVLVRPERVVLGERTIMLFSMVVFSALLAFGGVDRTGNLWIFVVPFIAFYITGQRHGWYWTGLFALLIFILVTARLNLPDVSVYTRAELIIHLLSLLFYTMLAAIFNLVRDNWEGKLKHLVEARTAEALASEAKYRRLVDGLHDHFIFMHDVDGRITYVSPAVRGILGYDSDNLDHDFREFLTDAPLNETAMRVNERLLRGEKQPAYEMEVRHANGNRRLLEVTATPLFDEQGAVVAIEGLAQDITQRRADEIERKLLQEQMEHVQRLEALGVLAGGIAHDFNNLIAVIMLNAEIAHSQPAASGVPVACLERISQAGRKAADLCRQMLAYAGKGPRYPELVHFDDLLQEMRSLLLVSIGKKVDLRIDCPHGIPPVHIDRSQIQQVMMNLIINASDAIGEKVGRIVVSCSTLHLEGDLPAGWLGDPVAAGNYVFLEVRDTGCGMAPAVRERIFEPFFTTKSSGRGLGMSAVLGIVRSHGGRIHLESEPGVGSVFLLLFPAATAEALDEDEKGLVGEVAPLPVAKILVVDDEQELREALAQFLISLGMLVTTAVDGEEAVRIYRREGASIDLVILDMNMPKMNGTEVLRAIQTLRPQAKVVLSSGYTEQSQLIEVTQARVAGFLEKPYSLAQVTQMLQQQLGRG